MKKVLLLLLGGGLLIAGCSHFQGVRNAQEIGETRMERIDLLNSCEGGTLWTFAEDGFRLECVPRVFHLNPEFSLANKGIQGGASPSGVGSAASAAATATAAAAPAGPAAPGNAPGSAPASGPSAPASAGPAAPAGGQGGTSSGSPGVGK